ncbi:MAG TPA: hypothetical protein VL949_06915 [Geobacteraceae bacterium]|nr:hypothetical protein [Geobacteraceae bacterium]
MKTTEKSPPVGKIASCLIVAIVLAGSVLVPSLSHLEQGEGIMATLFLCFIGAIIAIQVVPGMMLFGMMVKGVYNLVRKEEARKEVR